MDHTRYFLDSQSSSTFSIQVNSSLVEGLISILLDTFLLAFLDVICQSICSSHSLHLLYNKRQKLNLKTFSFPFLHHGPVGQRWLSSTLNIVTLACSLCVILMGFATNGRSDSQYINPRFMTIIHIPSRPTPFTIDYDNEYRTEVNQTGKRPKYTSLRLAALQKITLCQRCEFSHCEFLAYALPDKVYDETLVVAADEAKLIKAECVTQLEFNSDIVSWRYERMRYIGLSCDILGVNVSTEDSPVRNAAFAVGDCDLKIDMIKCFYRKDTTVHCAGVGKKKDNVLMLIVIKDADNLSTDSQEITPSILRRFKFTSSETELYLANIAFMASLDLGPAWQLDLMAVSEIVYNAILPKRNKTSKQVRLTDIDKRIAYPSFIFFSAIFMFLFIFSGLQWFLVVYRQNRMHFNTFSTISDFLQLLTPLEEQPIKDGGLLKGFSSIVIGNGKPALSVLPEKQSLDYISGDWLEKDIL